MTMKQPTIDDIYMADAYITTPGVRQGLLERAAGGNDDEVITEDTDDGQVVYYRTPYGEMVPVGRPTQVAPVGPPGTRPGDVLVAEVGSRNLPEQAYSGRYPDTIKPFDPTVRQQLADFLQAGFEKFGMDRFRARKQAQTLMGGESSNLPISLGLADIVPVLGTALQTQEAARMGEQAVESAQQGNIGTAAIQAGGAALGMIPGAVGTVKAARKVGGMAGEAIDQAMTQGTGPAARIIPQAVRPMNVVPPGSATNVAPPLTKDERSVVINFAGRNPAKRELATDAVRDMHMSYPEADGWAPIEINKVDGKLDKAGELVKVEIAPKAIPYDFHTPPADVPIEAWQATMSSRVLDEVQAVVDRAAAGDKAALDILAEASWYRTMRDRLRTEFGGIGDVFADVLGTTSAQTDVRQNFKNAVTILTKFSRGDYDKTLAAYDARVAKGQPVDAKTLTELDKAGEFDLIKSDAGMLFNTNSPATMGALLDMFRAIKMGDSPKTPNFTGNLIGLTNEATIDVWAARMLRRLADLPRIPPPAEQGVAGSHLKGSTLFDPKVGSEFGFGQDVFREAADEINKSGIIKNIAPDIGDLGPDDLQAVAWFIEKERWTNNGWTTKAGEGGSLDYEMSLAGAADQGRISDLRKGINKSFQAPARRKGELIMGEQAYEYRVNPLREQDLANKEAMRQELLQSKASVDRYTLGISGERPDKPMSNYGQAELAAEFDDVVRADPSVVTYNLANTYGSFMAQTERALNAEFVTRQNFNPAPLERRLVEQGKAYDQDAVFISKVLKDGTGPNARPGVEIYFKQKITPQQMEKVTEKLRQYGVDGFTYVTDMRFSDRINVQARAGGAETAGLNGIRFQYIPEFDDAYNAANRSQIMADKQRLFDKLVTDIIGEGNVSDARLVWYDTTVHFRSDYDAYLERAAEGARATPGQGSPGGADAARPDQRGEIRQGVSGTVSDRRSRKTGILSGQEVSGGRPAPQKGAK